MSNTIKLSFEEIRTISRSYLDASDQINDTLSKLSSAQTELSAVWEGDAFNAFDEQFTALSPKVSQFAQLMEDINKQLNDIANAVESTDNEISNIVSKNTTSF